MNKYQFYFLALLLGALIFSCNATQGIADQTVSSGVPKDGLPRPLIDWMRSQAGVDVRGTDPDYLVVVRGFNSFSDGASNEPLYVIDGLAVGRKYKDATANLDPHLIKRVVVVPPPRAGKYGSRGANGVIEITTKANTL